RHWRRQPRSARPRCCADGSTPCRGTSRQHKAAPDRISIRDACPPERPSNKHGSNGETEVASRYPVPAPLFRERACCREFQLPKSRKSASRLFSAAFAKRGGQLPPALVREGDKAARSRPLWQRCDTAPGRKNAAGLPVVRIRLANW